MTTITSKDAQNRFGELIDTARREPVAITRRNRTVAVVISNEEYERLRLIEDAIWAQRAKEGAESALLSAEETAAFLQEKLNAID